MKVNQQKTQLLAMCPATTEEVTTFIQLPDGEVVESQKTLKILGFVFGPRPTVQPHLDHTTMKFRSRAWLIRHLKHANINQSDLKRLYQVLVLPTLDYGSIIYHCMLNKEQVEFLEKLQTNVLKIIYGFKKSREEIMAISEIETLWDRCERLLDKFLAKTKASDRFGQDWFPQKTFFHMDLRNENIYEEKFARTQNLYQSPKYMRRRLNGGLS